MGCLGPKGYVQLAFRGRGRPPVRLHRLVAWHCGMLPDLHEPGIDIHHRNGRRTDNRPENLEPLEHANHACKRKRCPDKVACCLGCGRLFLSQPHAHNSKYTRFCSHKCYYASGDEGRRLVRSPAAIERALAPVKGGLDRTLLARQPARPVSAYA